MKGSDQCLDYQNVWWLTRYVTVGIHEVSVQFLPLDHSELQGDSISICVRDDSNKRMYTRRTCKIWIYDYCIINTFNPSKTNNTLLE